MPDNLFDKQAQDALNNIKVDFNPDDWAKMEALLDKQNPRVPFYLNWKFLGVAAALLLLFSIGGYYAFQNLNISNHGISNPIQNANNPENVPEGNMQSKGKMNNSSLEIPSMKDEALFSENEVSKSQQDNLKTQKIYEPRQSAEIKDDKTGTSGQWISQTLAGKEKTITSDKVTLIEGKDIDPAAKNENPGFDKTNLQETVMIDYALKARPAYSLAEIHAGLFDHEPLGIEKPKVRKTLFYMGAQISPSSVVLNRVSTGFEGGFVAGMHIGKVFSIESGIYYTRLNVNQDVSEIQQKYELTNIKGKLQYINIPVMAIYSKRISPRMKFFVKGGISNLFTIRESLTYTYIDPPTTGGPVQASSVPLIVNTIYTPAPGLFESFSLDGSLSFNNYAATSSTGTTRRYQALGRLGAGIEYGIGQRSSFRLSLDYQFPFSGLTVENLKAHVIGLGLGWKQIIGRL
jgi:outer membrane protein with beta-barrel domain